MQLKLSSVLGKTPSLAVLLFAFCMNSAHASTQKVTPRPCDIFASATPCVVAISTTRALYRAYTGPLYQVTRQSDKAHADIGLLPDGYADAASRMLSALIRPVLSPNFMTSRPNTITLRLRLRAEHRAGPVLMAMTSRQLRMLCRQLRPDIRSTALSSLLAWATATIALKIQR